MIPQRLSHEALVWITAAVAALASGCASGPGRDGPPANPPAGLDRVPNAEPRVEPLRQGGPNKPYAVLGDSHAPITADRPMRDVGGASWYGRKFHGRPTASGEIYDMYAMTAAHRTMPIPSYARVRNPANGSEIIVRVNDRGPFAPGRVIDLSYTAALKLGVLGGVATVQVDRLTHDEIRAGIDAGTWRQGLAEAAAATPPQPVVAIAIAPPPTPPLVAPDQPGAQASGGFWLQLGAFRQRDGALQLQQRLQREAGGVRTRVFDERSLFRVQAGPFASRAEALDMADTLRAMLALTPLLLERR